MNNFLISQVSSDMSTLDFDLPLAVAVFATSGIELLSIIVIMATVTWPVLIVAIPAIMASIFVQVNPSSVAKFA